ncbi:MAG: hypothetical protein QXT19_01080 [Candidatus Woesearchaeota archaeon]
MATKRAARRKTRQRAPKRKVSHKVVGRRAHKPEKKAPPTETKMQALLPPMDRELFEEEPKPKDDFFDEEELKEFSIVDEEEGADEDSGEHAESEPAWDEEEY